MVEPKEPFPADRWNFMATGHHAVTVAEGGEGGCVAPRVSGPARGAAWGGVARRGAPVSGHVMRIWLVSQYITPPGESISGETFTGTGIRAAREAREARKLENKQQARCFAASRRGVSSVLS